MIDIDEILNGPRDYSTHTPIRPSPITLEWVERAAVSGLYGPGGHNIILRLLEIIKALQGPTAKGRAVAKTIPADWPADYRERFWGRYPNRKAKAHAMRALDKVAFAGKTAWADLWVGLERYINSETVKRGFAKHPATWVNAECWKDEPGPGDEGGAPGPRGGNNGGGPGFFEIAAGMDDRQ